MKRMPTKKEAVNFLNELQYASYIPESAKIKIAALKLSILEEMEGNFLWGKEIMKFLPVYEEIKDVPELEDEEWWRENVEAFKAAKKEALEYIKEEA